MRAIGVAALLALAGCASAPPPPAPLNLKLAPAALGASISLQQHIKVEREGRTDELDAALEVDPEQLSLVGLAMGQRVMTLHYDGNTLTSWRHLLMPSQVRGEDVLQDIQLTYWPVTAIRQALPPGWRIEDDGMHRTLWSDNMPVTVIDYSSQPRWGGTVVLSSLRYHYRLTIQSVPASQ